MAVTANNFISPQTPFSRTAVATTAETAFQAPTNVIDLLTAADNVNGAWVTLLYALPRAANAGNNNCQLYTRSGSTYTLIDSALLAAVTPSATVANAKATFNYSPEAPLYLTANVGLAVAIGATIANGVVFVAEGGLY